MSATLPPPEATGHRPARRAPATPDRPLSPLVQLTLARFREFVREPEAVFWTFVFPILMASGLGIAFRSRPAS